MTPRRIFVLKTSVHAASSAHFLCVILVVALFCLISTGVFLSAGEEHEHPIPEKLGAVEFPISCSGEAQAKFERAMALLHSFAYSAAETAFNEVIEADPNCAMAHWGVAMAYFHQLWEPPIPSAKIAGGKMEIERAKALASVPRERELIDALELIYTEPDTLSYQERLKRYTGAMKKIVQRYRDDAECQIFYALSLVAIAQSADDARHLRQKEAAAILQPLFEKYPQHPGIAHYLIHACDNPEMARQATAAARAYSKIAPSAPHALHMPSHIYTRLGMWEDSINSNLAARAAARTQGDKGEELHAMDYLTYAYLQLGRDNEARQVVAEWPAVSGSDPGDFKVGYAESAMPVRYALERRKWSEAAQLRPVDHAEPQAVAVTLWARSVGQARSGNPTAAREEIEKLRTIRDQVRALGDAYWATQVGLQLNEALAWTAYAEGEHDEAERLMRLAADEEDAVEKRPVTPGPVLPAREQLGDLLMELGDTKGASKEFNSALSQSPNRRGALEGLARANGSSSP